MTWLTVQRAAHMPDVNRRPSSEVWYIEMRISIRKDMRYARPGTNGFELKSRSTLMRWT